MKLDEFGTPHFWHIVTRLGEMQILLPAALLVAVAFLWRPDTRRLGVRWIALLSVATLLTAASKIVFIGWGLGWADANFTGVSGHSMFAAAIYPLLLVALAYRASPPVRHVALLAGCALAILVGASRILVHAHSVSEVSAGLALGGTVSALVLAAAHAPPALSNPAIPISVALWLALMPAYAPASHSHAVVARIALALSGHQKPHTRCELLRKLCEQRAIPECNCRHEAAGYS